jgi:hypothetical protein
VIPLAQTEVISGFLYASQIQKNLLSIFKVAARAGLVPVATSAAIRHTNHWLTNNYGQHPVSKWKKARCTE